MNGERSLLMETFDSTPVLGETIEVSVQDEEENPNLALVTVVSYFHSLFDPPLIFEVHGEAL